MANIILAKHHHVSITIVFIKVYNITIFIPYNLYLNHVVMYCIYKL